MSWIDSQLSNKGLDLGNIGQGLLNFLQKPEAMGLAQGLLSQATPSMTEPRSFNGALQAGLREVAAVQDKKKKEEFEKARIAILQGQLNVDIAKFNQQEKEYLQKLKHEQELRDLFKADESPDDSEIPAEQPIPEPQAHNQYQQMPTTNGILSDKNPVQPMPVKGPGILGGMNNEQMAQPLPAIQPPAPMPQSQQAAPEQKSNLIKLGNGWKVTPEQYRQIQAAVISKHPEKIVDILKADTTAIPNAVKIAKEAGLVPGTPEYNDFLKQSVLHKGVTVNIGDEATRATVTKLQNVITGVDSVVPSIDKLIKIAEEGNIPQQGLGAANLSPSKQAAYKSVTSQAIEPLLGSFGLNSNEHNAKVVAQQIEKQPFESDAAYIKRLKELKTELIHKRKYASEVTSFKGVEPITPAQPEIGSGSSNYEQYANSKVKITNKKTKKTEIVSFAEGIKRGVPPEDLVGVIVNE